MYANIIVYRLSPIFERDFLRHWTSFVNLMKERQFIVDASMHRENRVTFVAYTRYADRESYQRSKEALKEGEGARLWQRVLDCCNSMEEPHRMEILQHQLKT